MIRQLHLYLDDILESVDLILARVENVDEETFKRDAEKYESIVYRFAIIGEAVNKIPQEYLEKYPHINWKAIISMRNILIHEYHDLDLEIIWDTIQNDIINLRESILEMLHS